MADWDLAVPFYMRIRPIQNIYCFPISAFPSSAFHRAFPTVLLYSGGMNRITLDPEQCGGRPCIRAMRIRVMDVLDLLANGLSQSQVLEELPDLEPEDIQACLQYASRKLNHPVLVAA